MYITISAVHVNLLILSKNGLNCDEAHLFSQQAVQRKIFQMAWRYLLTSVSLLVQYYVLDIISLTHVGTVNAY